MWLEKVKVLLGLDEPSYQDLDPEPAADRDGHGPPPRHPGQQPPSPPAEQQPPSAIGTVRPMASRRDEAPVGSTTMSGRSVGSPGTDSRARPQVVRPIAVMPNARPYILSPSSFNHVQDVADKFKSNQPVIMNLKAVDRELSRRLIDFASGLCYGLGGHMERVASQVMLLTPAHVEVSSEERRRLHERDYQS